MTSPAEIFEQSPWQMTLGERAALEGVLAQVEPRLAIEIGTAEGGSLQRIAAHSRHVHSFDLVEPGPVGKGLDNVTFHTGDSHALLPEVLERLAAEGQSVDFVLVDGDHSADGVEADIRDLLASAALRHTVILAHDTLNDEVREGISRVDYRGEPKVVHAELDFVGGHLSHGGPFDHQLWGGLGLILVDEGGEAPAGAAAGEGDFYDLFELVAPMRDAFVGGEAGVGTAEDRGDGGAALREQLDEARRALDAVTRSRSWRLTEPLRATKRLARRYR